MKKYCNLSFYCKFIRGEGALIPALPRPMTTYSESPFHFLASRNAEVRVYGHIDMASEQQFKNLYLIVFSANTDLELENIFLYGYRTRLAFEINDNICENSFPTNLYCLLLFHIVAKI